MYSKPALSPYILVVDDDSDAIELMRRALARIPEYRIRTASDVQEGLGVIQKYGLPSLAMVDLHMPEQDGFDFCRQVARQNLPIVMITAEDSGQTAGHAIATYVEDYIRKPFDTGEMIARINRVLARHQNRNATASDTLLNPYKRTIVIDEKEIRLSPIEFKLLKLLVDAGEPVSRETLLVRVWGYRSQEAHDPLSVAIRRLRLKIEKDPEVPQRIRTIRQPDDSWGYVWQP